MGMVPPRLPFPRRGEDSMSYQPLPPRRTPKGEAQPKEEHSSSLHSEMQLGDLCDDLPSGSNVIGEVPWESLPVSEITGLLYDPELIQEWPPQGRNSATLKLMKRIQEELH